MSGTDIAYGVPDIVYGAVWLRTFYAVSDTELVYCAIYLRACYAISGTDVRACYAISGTDAWYWHSMSSCLPTRVVCVARY
eukprot:2801254-Rhodomonas_salina.2